MKFRTDFVTNSSSANYMTVTFNFTDSTSDEVTVFEEGTGWNGYFDYSRNNKNELSFEDYPIKTIDELFACLYFYAEGGNSEIGVSIVPILTSVFLFITKKIDFDTMMERVQKYEVENGGSIDWYIIEDLKNISPDDFEDENQLIDEVLELFSYSSNDILDYYETLSEKGKTFSDIVRLVFYDNCRDWGEFLSHFYEELGFNDYVEDHFQQINKEDPLYEKEVNKWNDIFKEKVFPSDPGHKVYEFDYDPDIEAGLASGDSGDCLDDISGANTHSWTEFCLKDNNRLVESGINDKYINSDEKDANTTEHDLYFELFDCIQSGKNSWEKAAAVEKIKNIIKDRDIPKVFSNYPFTDLLDMALKFDENEIFEILISCNIELDFADVAHYIYNDTLETLYPLFDRGLKIDSSAYDDLINYASEQGKPDYTAWLLNRKNESVQNDDVKA